MSENILQTLQQLVQDVIAPDVRELKVRVASLEKDMDVRFNAIDQRLDAIDQKNELQFKALMAAISILQVRTERPRLAL